MKQTLKTRLYYFIIGGFALPTVVLFNIICDYLIHLVVHPYARFSITFVGKVCRPAAFFSIKVWFWAFCYLLLKILLIPLSAHLLRKQQLKLGTFVLLMCVSDIFILPLKIIDPTSKTIADLLFSDYRLYFLSYDLFKHFYVLPTLLGITGLLAQLKYFRNKTISMPLFLIGLSGFVCAIFGGGFLIRFL